MLTNFAIKPVFLFSDLLLWALFAIGLFAAWRVRRQAGFGKSAAAQRWRRVGQSKTGMAATTVLLLFVLIGLLDSVHFRTRLPDSGAAPNRTATYSVDVLSVLDASLPRLKNQTEKTYSAPLATHSFAKESVENAQGEVIGRNFPRLQYGGKHLLLNATGETQGYVADVSGRIGLGLLAGGVVAALLSLLLRRCFGQTSLAWQSVAVTLAVLALLVGPMVALASGYHVLGTDKVGHDVLYLALKSIRTGLVIGTITTLVLLPFAVLLGILAGYAGGWVDDLIQYLYTTLNSIPGVLLIAASVLMLQVVIELHPDWFSSAVERGDARLLALCLILGMTSWTGLARLLRGETLKLRELEYVQAARAFGVGHMAIMLRHILPNLMHIVLISLVMDFSGLVLAEAVLSYVGIGVDASTISFGSMINAARLELAREPMVWWSLAAAFSFMFALVLAANLLADVVRDAFDPRSNS